MPRKALVAAALALLLAGCGGAHGTSPRTFGSRLDRPVPQISLVDQRGQTVTFGDFRGKVVVLSPFLSLCTEVCPLTTGVFERLQREFGKRVVFVEATVDPWRDSPARLRAYARMTHAGFPLLTGSKAQIAKLWHFFGVGYRRVPQGKPPAVDWWTHKPLTFDVEHTDGVFFIDARGRERLLMTGMPAAGTLPNDLKHLLGNTGLQNLRHPLGAWTPAQARADVSYLLSKKFQ